MPRTIILMGNASTLLSCCNKGKVDPHSGKSKKERRSRERSAKEPRTGGNKSQVRNSDLSIADQPPLALACPNVEESIINVQSVTKMQTNYNDDGYFSADDREYYKKKYADEEKNVSVPVGKFK